MLPTKVHQNSQIKRQVRSGYASGSSVSGVWVGLEKPVVTTFSLWSRSYTCGVAGVRSTGQPSTGTSAISSRGEQPGRIKAACKAMRGVRPTPKIVRLLTATIAPSY
jgi:hypothetical protein